MIDDASSSPPAPPDARRAFARAPISALFASGLGAGLSPVAPGTAGSAVGLFLSWLLSRALWAGDGTSVLAGVGLLTSGLLLALIGVPAATRAARESGAEDPGFIVIDEVAGQAIAASAVPLFAYPTAWREAAAWFAAFFLFRLFDVWKPGAIRRIQSLPGGWGIVADDVLAGLLAAGGTSVVAWILSTGRLWGS